MKKIVAIILIFPILLSSCGSDSTPEVTDARSDFFIETMQLSKQSGGYTVEKSARLTAGSSLSLPSDGVGQVEQVLVKEGQSVKKGQVLVKLRDTAAMYGIQVQQANNSVTSASAAREATLANLDQAVTNAEIAKSQAERSLNSLKKDIKERRKQAENDYYNANPDNTGSTAQLNLAKLKIDLASAEDNFNNQISTLDTNYHLYANDFEKLSNSMLFEGDRILGITSTYQYANDNWEPYLGLYLGNVKTDAANKWGSLYTARGDIRAKKDIKITSSNAKDEINTLATYYQTARDMGTAMSSMLENSMVGGGLSQDMLNGWISQWTGFRASEQASEVQFTTWKNTALAIIPSNTGSKSVAEMNIDSLKYQIAAAERNIQSGNDSATIGYNRTLISLEDSLKAAELSLEQAEKNLIAAKRNREATAKQLGASINSASTALSLARANYDKLTIKAPVDGKISKVNVSIGQSINTGTPVAEMTSNTPEMTVDTEADVALNLAPGDAVRVMVNTTTLTGSVVAVSRSANANLLYTTRVSVPTETSFIGQAVRVIFDISTTNSYSDITLPLSSVNIISENEGEIFLLTKSGSELLPKRKSVRLGSLRNTDIEIVETFGSNTEIILSDVSNFDSTKQKLLVDNKLVSGE